MSSIPSPAGRIRLSGFEPLPSADELAETTAKLAASHNPYAYMAGAYEELIAMAVEAWEVGADEKVGQVLAHAVRFVLAREAAGL